MAARKDGIHSERVRQRIRVSQLTRRLQDNALGLISMSQGQIDSAKFLINKVMANPPEQKELKHSGELSIAWPLPKSPLDQ